MKQDNTQDNTILLDAIANLIKDSETRLEEKIDSSVAELAAMTQNHFSTLEEKLAEVESDIQEIKLNTDDIKVDLNKKVDIFEHNDLTYRVEKLEKKLA